MQALLTDVQVAQRKIMMVSRDQPHTLIVKQGSRNVRLFFPVIVTGQDVKDFCEGQLGWNLKGVNMVVDGTTYTPDQASSVLLTSSARDDTRAVHISPAT